MHVPFSLSRKSTLTLAIALTAAAATGGVLAGTAGTATASPSCSAATLNGMYLFAGDGFSISGGTQTPLAFAGAEQFDGAGNVSGTSSSSFGGSITSHSAFTGTYTLNSDCTGTLTIGTSLHFDIYASRSGDRFVYVQTDPGSVSATTEHQATRA